MKPYIIIGPTEFECRFIRTLLKFNENTKVYLHISKGVANISPVIRNMLQYPNNDKYGDNFNYIITVETRSIDKEDEELIKGNIEYLGNCKEDNVIIVPFGPSIYDVLSIPKKFRNTETDIIEYCKKNVFK